MCIVQIERRNQEGIQKCYILRVFNYTVLPTQFLELFRDETMIFVGVRVVGDLSNIEIDFNCAEIIKNMKNIINLGKFARKRNMIRNRIISLQKNLNIALNESIRKFSIIRYSK